MEIKVRKKDGALEDFERSKISNGLLKAGALPQEAERITTEIENWSRTSAKDGIIASSDIRDKVLELLETANPRAAASFRAYKKPE